MSHIMKNCNCTNCTCTMDKHCGCMSSKGCSCKKSHGEEPCEYLDNSLDKLTDEIIHDPLTPLESQKKN